MSKLLKEVYHEYAISHHTFGNPNGKTLLEQLDSVTPMQHSKESFFNKIKTNDEFAKIWGVEVVEKELSLDERVKIYGVEKINTTDAGYYENSYAKLEVDEANIPTQLITITYKDKTEEIYE